MHLILDHNERMELLRIARVTLKEWLRSGRTPPGAPHRRSLLAPSGAFVGLALDGAPRGSIGRVEPAKPLYTTVAELAIAVATRDPRFPALTLAELARTRIELAVLSPPIRLSSPPTGIEIGVHGVAVRRDGRDGLLLPSVAVERGWDEVAFLAETCAHAGLDRDAWKAAEVDVFTADVFAES